MSAQTTAGFTSALEREGVRERLDELVPPVYEELKRLAGRYLQREHAGHTLQATDLAHEAYLRLVDQSRVSWQGRTHFMAVAAIAMRRLLVDHAVRKGAAKRGGDQRRVTLDTSAGAPAAEMDLDQLLSLDAALKRLADLNARHARLVELRYFSGMTIVEAADVLGVSAKTVERDWVVARAWLASELGT